MPAMKVASDSNQNGEEIGSHHQKEEFIKVPPYHKAMLHMIDASWLNVNDHEEFDANRLFVGGNLNLSLICALLFTTFLPLYYSEAQRIDDPTDGLTIDISMGYLSPIKVSNQFVHDLFDCSYLVAAAGTLFGTMVSVFFMLAANEAADDAKAVVLLKFLGPQVAQTPYYFFSIGIIGWAFGAMFHVFVVPRTSSGFYVKVVMLWGLILFMLLIVFPRMIQGVFMGKLESQKHPPIYVSEEKIQSALVRFFADPHRDGDISLERFLQSLSYLTEYDYRPRLQAITHIKATCMYYEKLAEVTGRTIEEVKEIINRK